MDEHSGEPVVVHRISDTEVVAFGRPEELDLLGSTRTEIDQPFVDAMRAVIAVAPVLQGAADGLTGRVLRLTAEGARLLSANESMSTSVITGAVRNPDTGRIAGQLTFTDPNSLAGLADSLPSLAGGAAMQLALLRIEQSLDGLKADLGYLIRSEHLKVEAGIETNLEILHEVHAASRRHGAVDNDQWDRVANLEVSVRSMHKETKKHLRSLEEALDGGGQRLAVKVARLNRALDDERTLFWLRAHVHAELALARWDSIYLLRQVQQHPEELEDLVARLYRQVEERYAVLAELSARVAKYLSAGDAVTTWTDRLRLVRRTKLRSLLIELDEVLKVFPPELEPARVTQESERAPIPLGDGSQERRQWDELVAGARSLPQSAAAALVTAGSKLPGLARGDRSDDTPPV